MARRLPTIVMQKLPFFSMPVASLLGLIIGVFSVFSIVTFLCGSHKKERTVRLGDQKKPISRLQSSISSKALLLAKMISCRKVQQEEEEEEREAEDEEGFGCEEAVWRRAIIMGEKCRPLEFSGKILYDEHGNLLPDTPRDQGRTNKIVTLGKS